MSSKICNKCGVDKGINEFSSNGPGKHRGSCRPCTASKQKIRDRAKKIAVEPEPEPIADAIIDAPQNIPLSVTRISETYAHIIAANTIEELVARQSEMNERIEIILLACNISGLTRPSIS